MELYFFRQLYRFAVAPFDDVLAREDAAKRSHAALFFLFGFAGISFELLVMDVEWEPPGDRLVLIPIIVAAVGYYTARRGLGLYRWMVALLMAFMTIRFTVFPLQMTEEQLLFSLVQLQVVPVFIASMVLTPLATMTYAAAYLVLAVGFLFFNGHGMAGEAAAAVPYSLILLGFYITVLYQQQNLRGQSERNERAALDSEEAKTRFVSKMSHELRTPLNSIIGFTQALKQPGVNNSEKAIYLENIDLAGRHLLRLIGDVLDYGKLEKGLRQLNPAPFCLDGIVDACQSGFRWRADEKGIFLQVEQQTGDGLWLLGDVTAIKQVIFNLIDNAIKFTDEGGVTVAVRHAPTGDGKGCRLTFTVSDTGTGIPNTLMEGLFDEFIQGESGSTRSHGGAGLGLNIARHLSQLMNGELTAATGAGGGAEFVFTLTLPVTEEPPQPAEPVEETKQPTYSLLAVDDVSVNLAVVTALVGKSGHRVDTASSAREALDKIEANPPYDAILMDVHMPEMDGIEAARVIRTLPDPAKSRVPVIALTADAEADQHRHFIESGMASVLTKPFSLERLNRILQQVIPS